MCHVLPTVFDISMATAFWHEGQAKSRLLWPNSSYSLLISSSIAQLALSFTLLSRYNKLKFTLYPVCLVEYLTPRWWVSDGGHNASWDATCCHDQQKISHLVEQAEGYLFFFLRREKCLMSYYNENPGRGSIAPLYHSGSIISRMGKVQKKPHSNLYFQFTEFTTRTVHDLVLL